MNIHRTAAVPGRRSQLAFTLVEVCMSVAIVAVMMVSLYAGMSSSFSITQAARENLRATQIMLERVEGLRLYNWEQLIYSNWIPSVFTNYYYPLARTGESKGITYYGTIQVAQPTLIPTATYSTNMRAITVTVFWTNYYGNRMTNKVVRSRSMTTYTARDGIQNYVFYN